MGCIPRIHLKGKIILQFALDIRSNTASSHEKGKKIPLLTKRLHTRVQISASEILNKSQVFLNMYVYFHATQTF